MRRFFWGFAIASLTASAPISAFGGDREIANNIISLVKMHQAKGSLKGFDIDLNVESGVVTLSGSVANADQATAVLAAAYETAGVVDVVDNIDVKNASRSSRNSSPVAKADYRFQNGRNVRQVSNFEGENDLPIMINSNKVPSPQWKPDAMEPPKFNAGSDAVSPNDAAVTNDCLSKLSEAKSAGSLRQFEIDLSTVEGEVWVRGNVANSQQKQLVLKTIQHVRGVKKVIDDIAVNEAKSRAPVQPASNTRPVESTQYGSMPVVGSHSSGPRPA